jgi:hypothetical protein
MSGIAFFMLGGFFLQSIEFVSPVIFHLATKEITVSVFIETF